MCDLSTYKCIIMYIMYIYIYIMRSVVYSYLGACIFHGQLHPLTEVSLCVPYVCVEKNLRVGILRAQRTFHFYDFYLNIFHIPLPLIDRRCLYIHVCIIVNTWACLCVILCIDHEAVMTAHKGPSPEGAIITAERCILVRSC